MRVVRFRDDRDVENVTPAVVDHLAGAGLLAHPTETVYGLGCRPESIALSVLAHAKRRDPANPFLILVSSRTMAEGWGLVFDGGGDELARAFWPGPLTLVLTTTGSKLPDSLKGPTGGIAVRCTSHQTLNTLIDRLGHPITSTSANRSGTAPATDVDTIQRTFSDGANLLILDGGNLEPKPPSTVLDCMGGKPALVREGAISLDELRQRIGGGTI